ncbi:MAG: hypothetical protein H6Q72_1423 [Firmicutes bacterium]|nr:hypothetical protein [Bacillota bacterium]
MLADARNELNWSQERAAEEAELPKKAIAKYEVYPEVATPARILKLSETYKNPEILEWYCTDVCPVGKKQHCKMVSNGLTGAAMSVVAETMDLQLLQHLLMKITCDGRIDTNELCDMEKIMIEIEHVERALHALKIQFTKELSRIEREKSPVRQHRRVS